MHLYLHDRFCGLQFRRRSHYAVKFVSKSELNAPARRLAHLVERQSAEREDAGSNPGQTNNQGFSKTLLQLCWL